MTPKKKDWCIECGWLVVKVSIDSSSAYWCRANESRIDGPVTWRPACERFIRGDRSRY